MRTKLTHFVLCALAMSASEAMAQATSDCTKLDAALRGGGERFEIGESGRYCLVRNLSTRLDLPDRREQSFLIAIFADDVEIDLGGHTLDRGSNRSGDGMPAILLSPRIVGGLGPKNIVISNGTIRGMGSGVAGRLDCTRVDCEKTEITYDVASDTYYYGPDNVTTKRVKFENVKYKLSFTDGRGNRISIAGDRR